jgi:hypothetical protein
MDRFCDAEATLKNGKLLRCRSAVVVRLSPFAPRKVPADKYYLSRLDRRLSILLVEMAASVIQWMKPDDFHI